MTRPGMPQGGSIFEHTAGEPDGFADSDSAFFRVREDIDAAVETLQRQFPDAEVVVESESVLDPTASAPESRAQRLDRRAGEIMLESMPAAWRGEDADYDEAVLFADAKGQALLEETGDA